MQPTLEEETIELSSRKQARYKHRQRVRFDLFADEKEQLDQIAKEAGLSVMEYCRRMCLGKTVTSRFDYDTGEILLRVNGDLARLGNLLNQAIAKEGSDYQKAKIHSIIDDIHKTQTQLKNIVMDI